MHHLQPPPRVSAHLGTSLECWTDVNKSPIPLDVCGSVLWAWAPGMGTFKLPRAAGFKIPANGNKYLLLEIHYDNSEHHLGNVTDTSSLVVTISTTPRQYEAAVLLTADPLVTNKQPIPPQSNEVQFEFSCSAACTSRWPYDITIFGDFLHLHRLGTRAASHINSNQTLTQIDFYNTTVQQTVVQETVLKRGDRLNTHCVYNTAKKIDPTKFGITATDEQCMEFIYYYPAIPNMNYCGFYFQNGSQNITVCGNPFIPNSNSLIQEVGPLFLDGSLGGYTFGTDSPCTNEQELVEEGSISIVAVYKASAAGMAGMIIFALVIIVGMNVGLFILALKAKEEALPIAGQGSAHIQLEDQI